MLAVYPGGFDLDAAVAAGSAAGIDDADVIDLLDGLVAKSLVTATPAEGSLRYGMLETLRAYGVERLEESGRVGLARDRHADYYAAISRRVRASAVRAWDDELSRLDSRVRRTRAAVRWTLVADLDPNRAFELLAPLCYVGLVQNAEVAELAEKALDMWPTTGHPLVRSRGGRCKRVICARELDRARVRAQEAVDAGSPVGAALAHAALAGVSSAADHDPVAALVHLDRAGAAVAGGFEPIRSDLMNLRAEFLAQAGRLEEAFAVRRAGAIDGCRPRQPVHRRRGSVSAGHAACPQSAGRTAVAGGCAGRIASRRILVRRRWELRGLAVLCAEEGDVATAAGQFLDVLDRFICDASWPSAGPLWQPASCCWSRAGRREAAAVSCCGSSKRWRSSLTGQCTGPGGGG